MSDDAKAAIAGLLMLVLMSLAVFSLNRCYNADQDIRKAKEECLVRCKLAKVSDPALCPEVCGTEVYP